MDPERLGNLIDAHAAALELFAAQWTDSPEDVVQEAFVELAGRDDEPDQPRAWLFAVVRNRSISSARSRERRRRHEAGAAIVERLLPTTEDTLDAETAAEAVAELPEDQREVVIARIWGGLGFAEIGTIIGASSSTTHRRYEAAIESLRHRLGLQWIRNEETSSETIETNPATSSPS